MIDYTFVSIVFMFCFGTIFMLYAFTDKYPNKVLWHFLAFLFNLFAAQFYLMTGASVSVPMHYAFYLLAVVNFLFFLAWGMWGFAEVAKRRKYGSEEEE